MGAPQGSVPLTSTVINMQTETPGRDYVVWSLFNTLFLNWFCLGFVAFAYSVKSRDRKMVGDVLGAQSYASTAKCLNVWALALGILLTIGVIVLLSTRLQCTCLLPGVTSGCHYALLLLPQPPGSVPAPLEGWREGQGSWRSEQHPSSAPGTLVPANFLQNCPDQEISCLPGSLPAQDEWALGVPQGRLPTTSWTVGGAEVHLALSPPRPS
ncbi:uncharacterized protein LOC102513749 [Camelus ferus]|nr:uncharacterized protein LOC102513749 [Camelus ferus]